MRRESGSLLILTLVAVSVVTLLAVSLGSWIGAQSRALEASRYRREVRDGAHHAAVLCLAERVLPDTNRFDAVIEPWSLEPWERREAGWVMRVSGHGWRDEPGQTTGLVDESGKVSINAAPALLLARLFREVAEMPREEAEACARRLVDWRDDDLTTEDGRTLEAVAYGTRETPWEAPNRPFVCVEELAGIPGIPAGAAAAVGPHLTVEGSGLINLNTAAEPVLRAALLAASAGDDVPAIRLSARILAHRRAGNVFADPAMHAIGRDLGGLPPDEAALLGRVEGFVAVRSTAVSGVAEATPAAAWAAGRRGGRAFFTWSREQARFTRWIEE